MTSAYERGRGRARVRRGPGAGAAARSATVSARGDAARRPAHLLAAMSPAAAAASLAGQLIGGGATHSLWVIALGVLLVAVIAALVLLNPRTRERRRSRR